MKRNILMTIFAAMILVFFASSCGNSGKTSLVKEPVKVQSEKASIVKKYKIALVMKTLTNPFFIEMEKGARRAETELGVDLTVKTGAKETSIEQQIQIIEELIIQKADAIVIAPGSSIDLVRVLKKAQDAGIKIVNIDNRLDAQESANEGLKDVPFISVRNDDGAYLAVKELVKNINSPTQALILEGIRDAENAKMRKEGALKAFSENRMISVVASESANWKIDESYEVTKTLFQKYPKATVVFCANDMMALGTVQYLKEKNMKNVIVGGFDNLEDAQKAIIEGLMMVTVDQQADLQGYKGVEAAKKLLEGNNVEKEIYVPVRLVTKGNIQK